MLVEQLPSTNDKLVVAIQIGNVTPDLIFACWVMPQLLAHWWSPKAVVDPRLGGRYSLTWPTLKQTLQGVYSVYDPPHTLAFTWKWDHEPERADPLRVHITLETIDTDVRLTLVHGTYSASAEDQDLRIDHHLTGWQHFLPRLDAFCQGLHRNGANLRE